ncbi:hypothetical protein SNEBB_004400 [Seison nebaliae]|nr:hypothetical protein SNEBB_004400 [Seison nebaliae]
MNKIEKCSCSRNLEEEFDNFRKESKEYENALEQQLELLEKEIEMEKKEKSILLNKLKSLKEGENRDRARHAKEMNVLQDDCMEMKTTIANLKEYIRELEQTVDRNEMSERITVESLKNIEERFNEEVEKNAILQSELQDKALLSESLQRMKDEVKELSDEMGMHRRAEDERLKKRQLKAETAISETKDALNRTLSINRTGHKERRTSSLLASIEECNYGKQLQQIKDNSMKNEVFQVEEDNVKIIPIKIDSPMKENLNGKKLPKKLQSPATLNSENDIDEFNTAFTENDGELPSGRKRRVFFMEGLAKMLQTASLTKERNRRNSKKSISPQSTLSNELNETLYERSFTQKHTSTTSPTALSLISDASSSSSATSSSSKKEKSIDTLVGRIKSFSKNFNYGLPAVNDSTSSLTTPVHVSKRQTNQEILKSLKSSSASEAKCLNIRSPSLSKMRQFCQKSSYNKVDKGMRRI